MKKILVTNLYGKKNIGDIAIREQGISLLQAVYPKAKYYLLCESIKNFPLNVNSKLDYEVAFAPYGYAIRSKSKQPRSLITKALRFSHILSFSSIFALLGKVSSTLLPKKGFFKYLYLIYNSDLVVAMGGGYFITAHPVKDFFGIMLNVLPVYIAKLYGKKVLILPSSFGPFGSRIHESLVGNAIRNTTFLAREKISYNLAKKYTKETYLVSDLALLTYENKYRAQSRKEYYALTLREVLSGTKISQEEFENCIVGFIQQYYKLYGEKCIFIPMASNSIEENDLLVADRLDKRISDKKIFSILYPKSVRDVKDTLKYAQFALCNRLHSAILSATVFTPFITIAYAHKTTGFMEKMDLDEWNFVVGDVSTQKLLNKCRALKKNNLYNKYVDKLIFAQRRTQEEKSKILMLITDD